MSDPAQIGPIAGRTLRVVVSGDPDATRVLLLVHAFPLGVQLFEPQRNAFAGWRIVAPALPGFDGSDRLEQPHVDAYAQHLLALLDHLRVERAVVGGVSLGGYVAFGLLRHAPERVAGLVLADTRSAADTDEARAARHRLLETVHQSGPAAVAAEMLPKLLGATSHRTRPELVARVRRLIEAQTTEGIAAAIQVLMSRPDSTPLLAGIRVPALVLVGSEDMLTPPAEMEQMAATIPGAHYVGIDGAGHLSNLEQPAAFNHLVGDFLTKFPR